MEMNLPQCEDWKRSLLTMTTTIKRSSENWRKIRGLIGCRSGRDSFRLAPALVTISLPNLTPREENRPPVCVTVCFWLVETPQWKVFFSAFVDKALMESDKVEMDDTRWKLFIPETFRAVNTTWLTTGQ